MKQLIIQASMYRSGSTLMFNIIRLVLEQAYGKNSVYSCFSDQYNPEDKRPYHLVKTHRPSQKMYDKCSFVFSTIREAEEVKASMQRRADINTDKRFSSECNLDKFDEFWNDFLWWKGQPKTDTFNYWQLIVCRKLVIMMTASRLDVLDKIDVNPIDASLNRLTPPKEGYDPVTLLHANHITK